MAYSINWYIENEVLYVHYSGVLDAEQLKESLQEGNRLIASSPRSWVHSISDVGDVTQPVPIKDSLRVMREVGVNPHAGWSMTIRERSLVVKLGASFGSSVFKMRFRAFETMDEAVAHLKTVDELLSWDKVHSEIVYY